MNIREKLKRLDSFHGREEQQPVKEIPGWVASAETGLSLKVIREEKSFFFLKENYFPVYDNPDFQTWRETGFDLTQFNRLTGNAAHKKLNLRKTIFFDLETTGLAGGAGTFAFLVGLGHLEADHIVVRQYLLPDFNHEWLLLKYVQQAFQAFRYTGTFNGKSFDIPLLKNRFLMNRMIPVLEDMRHIDILHIARRIWRDRLPACDLQTLEREILGKKREGDIDGNLIPYIYFEFIRRRDALILRDVLEHNYLDIVRMILLTLKLASIAKEPARELAHPRDRFRFAAYLYKICEYSQVIEIIEDTLSKPLNLAEKDKRDFLYLLSMAHKKLNNFSKVKEGLQKTLAEQHYNSDAIEEIAKLYEHREKDFGAALEVVNRGITYLETIRSLDNGRKVQKKLSEFKRRRNRLLQKLERKKGKG